MKNKVYNKLIAEVSSLIKNKNLETTKSEIDEILQELKIYWKVIKPILKAAKLLASPGISKIINEFIAIANQLCEDPDPQEQSELIEHFTILWQTIKPILESAKNFINNDQAVAVINEVIKIGDLLTVKK